jgi:sugar lactone lactonase YvrE
MIYDATPCELGEGALWHPGRQALFWFDILHKRLHMKGNAGLTVWEMPELTSAAGILSQDELLLASESALWRFDINTGMQTRLVALDADDPGARSNDGRADRQGGFWIGTMGKRGPADPGRGAIWRYHKGELRKLFPGLTIPNSICFSPGGGYAHFSDTVTQKVWRVALDADGWPKGEPALYLDLTAQGLYPDGAVMAADGTFWNAQWGAGRVAAYAPDGTFLRAVSFEGSAQTSCPAFGGADLTTLFCTSALEGMDTATRAANPNAGNTFAALGVTQGLPEPVVIL